MADGASVKRTRRKEARPGEIIAAGMAEFRQYGFERARLDRIAKAAGVAKGTIYLYFENKEALFEAAVEDYVVSMMEASEAEFAMDAQAPLKPLLVKFMDRVYTHFSSHGPLAIIRLLIEDGDRFPHLTEIYHRIAIRRGVVMLDAVLKRAIERGEIAESAMTRTPEIVVAPCMFYAINKLAFDGVYDLDLDGFKAAHQMMVFQGLGLD